jgi:iron complex outermembrane recepter protein
VSGRFLKQSSALALCIAALCMSAGASAQTGQGDAPDLAGPTEPAPAEAAASDEIIVTATRQAAPLSRVPISIAAYSQETLDKQGVRSVDDVARLTPGVTFNRTGFGLTTSISIRGISSGAGSATTGVYIDDTPIQTRDLGNSSSNTYPVIFDLERVEVLRGPQGTLFGAASEGGTVRFINARPNMNGFSGRARSEVEFTKNGAVSYEAGAAVGAAIVEDKLGFRVSAYHRRDGGFIDRQRYLSTGGRDEDVNSLESTAFRAALGWQPTEGLMITPSVFYQEVKSGDAGTVWANVSSTSQQRYLSGNDSPSPSKDRFVLPALLVEWDFGGVKLVSNTSYFDRRERSQYDYTLYDVSAFSSDGDPAEFYSNPDFYSNSPQTNRQNNWTQEVRLQNANPDSRLNWVIGGFWYKNRQRSTQTVNVPFLGSYFGLETEQDLIDFFGVPLIDGVIGYIDNFDATDEEIAGFGEVSYEIVDGLKVIAGVRVAKDKFKFTNFNDGPVSGGPRSAGGRGSENSTNPKFGVSWQVDANNLIYGTAARGYRIGGANRALPTTPNCTAALKSLGLDAAPSTYSSDSVWSYEVGTKNKMLDGRLRVAASAYYIDWSNIISAVGNLGSCPYAFTSNLGSATSKGFDLQVDVTPITGLTLGTSVGYNKATFGETRRADGAEQDIVTRDNTLGGAPWTIITTGEYEFAVGGSNSAYLRGTFEYRSRNRGLTPDRDPRQAEIYDPLLPLPPEIYDLELRAGVRVKSNWDISAFVKNALNQHPRLNFQRDAPSAQVFTYSPVRPISGGLTVSANF